MGLYISPQVIDGVSMENVSFGFEKDVALARGFTCDLPTGKIVRVKGSRGIGKSCFLKVLAGLQLPIHGSYFINDCRVSEMSFEEFLEFRLLIGYSFDYGGLLHNMTIKENLILPLRYHNVADEWLIEERVEWYLRHFDLWDVRNERPAFIPGSMRKEACVARAFVLEPEMVILDSPSVGMHKHNIARLKDLIVEKRDDGNLKHVFLASEDEEFFDDIVEHTLTLDDYITPLTSDRHEVVA